MGRRGPKPSGQTTEVIRIKTTTRDTIRRLAAELGLSQSEVVDRAVNLFEDEVRQKTSPESINRWLDMLMSKRKDNA